MNKEVAACRSAASGNELRERREIRCAVAQPAQMTRHLQRDAATGQRMPIA